MALLTCLSGIFFCGKMTDIGGTRHNRHAPSRATASTSAIFLRQQPSVLGTYPELDQIASLPYFASLLDIKRMQSYTIRRTEAMKIVLCKDNTSESVAMVLCSTSMPSSGSDAAAYFFEIKDS